MEKSLKILFADDNHADVQAAAKVLQKSLDFVYEQVDGLAGLMRYLAQTQPDLVITDLTLLDCNGLDIVKAVKSHHPELAVLVYSGSINDQMIESCYLQGIHAFVRKSDLRSLPHIVKNVLNSVQTLEELRHHQNQAGSGDKILCQHMHYAPDGICIVDKEGKFLEVNHSFEEITGFSGDDLKKMHIHDLINNENKDNGLHQIEEILQQGEVAIDLALRCKNKEIVWLRIKSVKLPNGNHMGFISNVTSRIQSEKEVFVNEARFRDALEQSHSVVWECDPNGLLTYVSPMCHLILGYLPEEIVGSKYIYDFQRPDDLPRYQKQWMQSLTSRQVFKDYVHKIVDKFGNIKYVSATGSPIYDDAGTYIGYRGVDHDVTARVISEQKLQLNETRLRALLEAAQDSVYLIDPQGYVLATNSIKAQSFGLSVEQLIGKCLYDLLPPDIAASRKEMIDKVCETGITLDFEELNGERWVYRKMFPVIRNTKVESVAVYGMDITEKKHADEANLMLASRLSAITEAVNDAIVMIDHEGCVSFWNKSAERIFGYAEDEILGKNLHELLAPTHYHTQHFEAFAAFRQTGQGSAVGKTIELIGKNKSGQEIPVELSISALRFKENWASVGIVRDISARKQTEAELRAKIDELERFNKLTIDRELRMIALKNEVNSLLAAAGKAPKYTIVSHNQPTP